MLIVPINPNVKSCLDTHSNTVNELLRLDIKKYKPKEITFQREGDLFYHVPNIIPQNHIAAFDVDGTLTYHEKALVPTHPDDIHLLPNRQESLTSLFKSGYTLVLFTNQKVKQESLKKKRVERIANLVKMLDVPVLAFIATGDDQYRKPEIGMWNKMKEFIPDIQRSFYVGDAIGRPQDFSDSDKLFAEKIGIVYYPPEFFFPRTNPQFDLHKKNMVVLVGMQGSGKTTFAEKKLVPRGFKLLSSDKFNNSSQLLKAVEQTAQEGKSMVIDATNPKQEVRNKYYSIAEKAGYEITVLYFVRNGYSHNKARSQHRVPPVALATYIKYLDPPTADNTPGRVVVMT